MTAANPCENCEVQRLAKNPISLDDRAASIHTCRFICFSLSLPLSLSRSYFYSFTLVLSLSRMIIVRRDSCRVASSCR